MHCVITGSSGQIGTNLALRCLELGHSVVGIDRRTNPWTDAFPTVAADLRTPASIAQVVAACGNVSGRPDALVHLAAYAKVHDLVEAPLRALDNVAMANHALEACRALGSRFLLASSREVYGDVDRALTHERDASVECVTSPYAASKLAAEGLVHAYTRSYGLPHLILRLSNVYGRYDADIERLPRVVPLFIRHIAAGQPVTVFGVDKVLDFTWIDDCVDGISRALARLVDGRVANETINLASGEGRTLLELAELIGLEVGCRPSIDVEPKRVGEVTRYVANLDKARALLGYAAAVGLNEGIARAVAWQREWAERAVLGHAAGRVSSG